MSVLENFDRWKEFLGDRIEQAQAGGMTNEQLENVAVKMGNYLANKVDPENPQERLLKHMWEANPDKKRDIAQMMINMATKH